jgi:hypothetical protein
MDDFWHALRRSDNGTWTVLAPTNLNHPKGRIQVTAGTRFAPGTNFMGVDVATLLDEEIRKKDAWKKPG